MKVALVRAWRAPPVRRSLCHMFPRVAARLRPLVLALSVASCAAPHSTDRTAGADRAAPSLVDIFSIPGLNGAPPRLRSLSADGEWALVDWKPVVRLESGALAWGDDESPHLIATSAEGQTLAGETSLRALLERLIELPPDTTPAGEGDASESATDESEGASAERASPGPMAWSESGATLAVEWRGVIALIDVGSRGVRILRLGSDAITNATAEDGRSPEPEARRDRGQKIRSLAFSNEDRELEVRTPRELYVFDLADESHPDAHCVTCEIEPSVGSMQWSDDRTKFYLSEGAFDPKDDEHESLGTRFFDAVSQRKQVLDGLTEIKSLEGARLSNDGRWLFGVEADRSRDPEPNLVPDYLTQRVTTIQARRDRADDLPPPRKLWMWDTSDGSRRALELPGETQFYFQPLGWAPQTDANSPARFAFRRLASDFRTQETWLWSEGDLRLVMLDRDPKWIGGPGGGMRWSDDGRRLVFTSESFAASSTPGRSQLFTLDVASGLVTQLTAVAGEVAQYSMHDGGVVVVASESDPNQRSLTLLTSDRTGARATTLDLGPCVISAPRAARGGAKVVFELERLGRPAELWCADLRTGDAQELTRTVPDEYATQDWILPRELTVDHPDGSRIWSHVYLPRGTRIERSGRPRACVVFIHGAGYLQNVTESMTEYAVNLMFHSRLASMGYVVVDVDYRGSAGYGQKFRTDVQGYLGNLELQDIALVVDELARRGVVDSKRVGCYGGSYGGFLTLMALFREPERWACGAALRSVTDWRSYSAGYTQPRLGRPSTEPEAYQRSSPIDLADSLDDPLLILHGMSDTNVFAQDSIRLIEKLIDLGKPFEAMLYPSQGHGFTDGPHWIDEYGRIERFLLEHLGAP